ncbi:hypothetical protein CR513_21023, partial [Mucuna pruriens]
MAPPQADLRQIGVEGFALIDRFFGPPRRSSVNDALGVYQVPNNHVGTEPALNSKDAAFHFFGISVVNYPKGKPQNHWGRRPNQF